MNKADVVLFEYRLFLKTCFHCAALIHYSWAVLTFAIFYFNEDIVDERIALIKWRSPGFLTFWVFIIQIIYLAFALLHDIMMWSRQHDSYKARYCEKQRDVIFSAYVVPNSFMICTVFWGIFFYDRELIMPSYLDAFIPMSLNHALHTDIVLVVILEYLLQPRVRTRSHSLYIKRLFSLHAVYSVVFFGTYIKTGVWLYPLFGVLPWTQRFLIVVLGLWANIVFFYFLGWWFNDWLWKDKLLATVQKTSENGSVKSKKL